MPTLTEKFSAKQLFIGGFFAPVVIAFLVYGLIAAKGAIGTIGSEARHIRGGKNAQVKLVEYSDFQCPFCARAHPTLQQILQEYGDKVSLEYRHYPLNFHPFAQKAAEASECAAEQGKFWQFHDYIFEHQAELSLAALPQWADTLGLNTRKFKACLDSSKYASKVQAQFQEGSAKGVDGTPNTFVNGQPVVGAQPYEAFKQIIDAELAK